MIARNAISTGRGAFGLRALRILFVAALLVAASTPALARDVSQEVGTPLAPGQIRGSVGGDIVDLVYAIEVTSASVLVATVTGATGSELGLYLFPPSTESIQTEIPITSSARPGGLQRVSALIRTPGTYFLNVNGRNTDRPREFTLSLRIQPDISPPEFVALEPRPRSPSDNVCIRIVARDTVSGVSRVGIRSATSELPPSWIAYTGTREYCARLSTGDGDRRIEVLVENGVGLVRTVGASVMIDDTPPSVRSTDPQQGATSLRTRPSISWRFTEPVRLSASPRTSVFATNQLGVPLNGEVLLTSGRQIATWVLDTPVAAGTTIIASLTGIVDDAGNSSLPIDTLEILRKRASALSLRVLKMRTNRVTLGYSVSRSLLGRPLLIEGFAGREWQPIGAFEAASISGSISVERGSSERVRIRWPGDDVVVPVVSKARLLP